MTVTFINSLLKKHPYYNKLTDFEKLTVLNIALTKYWEIKEKEVVHSLYPEGHIGYEDHIINNDTIVKIPQMMLQAQSLSTYTELNANLSDSKFVKEFTNKEITVIYQIALSKVASLIPEEYQIEGMYGDIQFSKALVFGHPTLTYGLREIIVKTIKAYLEDTIINQDLTRNKNYSSRFSLLEISSLKLPYYPFYAYMEATNVEYKFENYIINYSQMEMTEIEYGIRSSITEPNLEDEISSYAEELVVTYKKILTVT